MYHSSIDPYVAAATGSANVMPQKLRFYLCAYFNSYGNKGGYIMLGHCGGFGVGGEPLFGAYVGLRGGGVGAAGGGGLAEASCGGRCLIVWAPMLLPWLV
ncbi:hypothetical protein MKX03_019399, partial [Papaver bracteatum]